jgi:hypothetical protein
MMSNKLKILNVVKTKKITINRLLTISSSSMLLKMLAFGKYKPFLNHIEMNKIDYLKKLKLNFDKLLNHSLS